MRVAWARSSTPFVIPTKERAMTRGDGSWRRGCLAHLATMDGAPSSPCDPGAAQRCKRTAVARADPLCARHRALDQRMSLAAWLAEPQAAFTGDNLPFNRKSIDLALSKRSVGKVAIRDQGLNSMSRRSWRRADANAPALPATLNSLHQVAASMAPRLVSASTCAPNPTVVGI